MWLVGDRSSGRPLAIAFGVALIASTLVTHTLYVNRLNYSRSDFRYTWCWGVELADGGNPWLSVGTGGEQRGVAPCRICNYPPPMVRVFALLAPLGERSVYWVWQGAEIASFIAALIVLGHEALGSFDLAGLLTILALAFLFPPVDRTLHEGQVTLFLFSLTVAAWASSLRGHSAWAGFWLAGAIAVKLLPAILAGYFLVRLRVRELIWTAFFFAVIVLATGSSYWRDFLLIGGASTLLGERSLLLDRAQINLMAGVYSVAHGMMAAPDRSIWWLSVIIAIVLGTITVSLAMYATYLAPASVEAQGLCLGFWMSAALMLVPRSWFHELAMVVPLYLFAGVALWKGTCRPILRPVRWGLALLVLSLTLIVGDAYTSMLRPLHLYLCSTIAGFVGGCLLAGFGIDPIWPSPR